MANIAAALGQPRSPLDMSADAATAGQQHQHDPGLTAWTTSRGHVGAGNMLGVAPLLMSGVAAHPQIGWVDVVGLIALCGFVAPYFRKSGNKKSTSIAEMRDMFIMGLSWISAQICLYLSIRNHAPTFCHAVAALLDKYWPGPVTDVEQLVIGSIMGLLGGASLVAHFANWADRDIAKESKRTKVLILSVIVGGMIAFLAGQVVIEHKGLPVSTDSNQIMYLPAVDY